MATAPQTAAFACKCLNVLIRPTRVLDGQRDPDFIPVVVDDAAITIAHPQLTLRTRHKPVAPDVQQVSLSCLLCHSVVYRVANAIAPGEDAREGPILPTLDWVEKDVLRAATNEIDVARACLSADAIKRARSSPQFSSELNVLVPTPSVPEAPTERSPPSFALQLPFTPLFPPPPFTPTHPAFVHLAKAAAAVSEDRRRAAEAELNSIIHARIAALDSADVVLKSRVEAVWRAFRRSWKAEVDKLPGMDGRGGLGDTSARPSAAMPSMSIREFAPIHMARPSRAIEPLLEEDNENVPALITERQTPPQPSRPPAVPARASLLSASLSTSTFHHPHAQERSSSPLPPPPYASNPSTDSGDEAEDAPEYRPTTRPGASSLPLTFRRNMDPALDLSTSLHYTTIMEQEARLKAEAAQRAATATSVTESPRRRTDKDKNKRPGETPRKSTMSPKADGTPGSAKGKQRKVTFDTEPEVVMIAPVDEKEPDQQLEEVEFFGDMDDMHAPHPALAPPAAPPPPAPPVRNPRAVNPRVRTSGLVASSYRPPPTQPLAAMHVAASVPAPRALDAPAEDEDDPEYVATLRRLVAADLPSHRDAWRSGGRLWNAFRKRGGALEEVEEDTASSDDNHDDDEEGRSSAAARYGMAQSVPIAFAAAGDGALSARAARAAAYAARDAARGADPGVALGLVDYEDEDDKPPMSRSASQQQSHAPGSARDIARSILQRENELPDAGMWRSLA